MSNEQPKIITLNNLQDQLQDCSQQLLDLSKRNPYLNFRIKSAIEFDSDSWDYLVHRVSVRKNAFKVDKPKKAKNGSVGGLVPFDTTVEKNSKERAVPLGTEDDYKDKFRTLYNKSRLAQSEKGVNVIYLCLGLLHYSDNGPLQYSEGAKKTDFFAPLLIQPVSLSRESLDGPYTIEPDPNEEISTNLTLEEFFKRTLKVAFPAFNDRLDDPVEAYFSAIERVATKNGWVVDRRTFVQCLQYQKLAIFNDITRNQSDIEGSNLVDMMFGNENDLPIPEIDTDESTTLDQKMTPATNFDVLDADASQDAAVRYAMEGKSIILQGPPGTGKSQTITNIIANAMAQGKRVLFVAQKREALDVVYRNLGRCSFDIVLKNRNRSTGSLADFCLYLHDTRTKKKDVMSMLRTAMDYEQGQVDLSRRRDLSSLIQMRKELNETDFALHQPVEPLGKSVFECYGFVMKCETDNRYQFDLPNYLTYTYDQVKSICLAIVALSKTCAEYCDDIASKNPWYGYRCQDIAFTFPPDSLPSIKNCCDASQLFTDAFHEAVCALSIPEINENDLTLAKSDQCCRVIDILRDKRDVAFQVVSSLDISYLRGLIKTAEDQENSVKALYSQLQSRFAEALPLLHFLKMEAGIPTLGTDVSPLKTQIERSLDAFPTISALCDTNRDDIGVGQAFQDYHSALSSSNLLNSKLTNEFNDSIFTLDAERERQIVAERGIFSFLNKEYKAAKRLLISCLKKPTKKSGSEIESSYSALCDYKYALKKSEERKRYLEKSCPDLLKANLTDEDALIVTKGYKPLRELLDALDKYSDSWKEFSQAKAKLSEYFNSGIDKASIDPTALTSDLDWAEKVREFIDENVINNATLLALFKQKDYLSIAASQEESLAKATAGYKEALETIKHLFFNVANTDETKIDSPSMVDMLSRVLASTKDDYVSYAEYYQERQVLLEKYRLDSFISFIESHHLKSNDIPIIFEKTFYEKWLQYQINNNKSLTHVSQFSSVSMDSLVKQFQEMDVKQYQTAPAAVASHVIDRASASASVAYDYRENGRGSLRHEAFKQKKVLPTRVLFAEYLSDVLRVTPVLMMSPLSVSTLIRSNVKFDMVIFDEASQITPEDAVGSIYRGKQIIVAGDDQQLPPTDFFNTKLNDDDGDEDEDEDTSSASSYKSILDMFNASPLHRNQVMLQWHYRSKDEALIAFSNRKIYGSQLITFPSPRQDDSTQGVNFIYVGNGYWLGSGEGNPIEAKVVAQSIIEFFKKYGDLAHHSLRRSLGVVAFGVTQANAIESALYDLLEEPQNAPYQIFASDTGAEEPFFIKNLETVQGDQRDTIFLSVGYGKDAYGSKPLRYGPVQSDGGYRRLNVAITRAKYTVVVFSSIHGGEIPVDRAKSNSRGLFMLRDYLNYAESSNKANFLATDATESPLAKTESPFEEEVYLYLVRHSVKVAKQVGCSSYRIDFGIENPRKSGSYVLAVECDGATYHSAKNARERDRLRQHELESMGWTFYRIWSTDWFRNPEEQGKKLLNAIDHAIAKASDSGSVQVGLKP